MRAGQRTFARTAQRERSRITLTMIEATPRDGSVGRKPLQVGSFGKLLGASARMRELFANLERIAETDLSVLIQGETGTGKELVASSLHGASPRADRPFVVFDCSAVALTLADSELFGHQRGAFTGAFATRTGVFERANGGTIFLDEIGELPKALQPKLLRVLEQRNVRRLGDSRWLTLDVRVISATNRNLRAEVKRGNFREDLYYRLVGAHVTVPPLRDRLDDLELLAESFLSQKSPPRSLSELPPQARKMFKAYGWPGNVRELRNAVERALLTPERALDTDALWEPPASGAFSIFDDQGSVVPLRTARRSSAQEFERLYVRQLLEKTEGNVMRAAALAGVSRQMIHRLLAKYPY
jgi:transcriptional regulator with GAF, ATPase, and Fis domain